MGTTTIDDVCCGREEMLNNYAIECWVCNKWVELERSPEFYTKYPSLRCIDCQTPLLLSKEAML